MTTAALPTSARPYVLGPDDGQHIENLHLHILATGATTGALFAAICTNPGPGGPPLHTHRSHDEYFLVLKGRYLFQIGAERIEGGQGSFVAIPRGTVHTFASAGPEEGQLFAFNVPSGLEHFIARISALEAAGTPQAALHDLFAEYDSEINGPPLIEAAVEQGGQSD
jgi:quercetin dioxygenase-like cupin family protein